MNHPIHILGFAGSLRQGSYNRAALRAAVELVPADASLTIVDLPDAPGFNQDTESNPPAEITELKQKIQAADAVLVATPEYNYSVPGVLKNVLDWTSRPYGDSTWSRKPAAIMGASVSTLGTARAQYHLRQIFVYLNALVINRPEVMIGQAATRFDAAGKLTDEKTRDLLSKLLEDLVAWTRQLQKA